MVDQVLRIHSYLEIHKGRQSSIGLYQYLWVNLVHRLKVQRDHLNITTYLKQEL